jgi:dTDP-4-dehydrorhamnose 3,5-epimerase
MKIIPTKFEGLLVIKPDVFADERGYFFESYNSEKLSQLGYNWDFAQDNQSMSAKNVLRGLHFQYPPYEQAKLLRVISGRVLDVVVDLRKTSPTFGQWHAQELSGVDNEMLFVPPGFAHGFVSLEDDTIFFYKCSKPYNKESEGSVRWNDPDLAIDWIVEKPLLSAKDEEAPLMCELGKFF